MNDEQIKILKAFVKNSTEQSAGEPAYWIPDEHVARKIVSIGTAPTKVGDEPEPSEVAYFRNGQYIALYNVDPEEIKVVTPFPI
jgi:hypothetical protein